MIKMSKAWKTKEWKAQRDALIEGKCCEWCGSTEKLSIHHTHESRKRRDAIEQQVISHLIRKKMDNGEIPKQYQTHRVFTCTTCGYSEDIKHKPWKTITCKGCYKKYTLNERNTRSKGVVNYFLPKEQYKTFIKTNSDEINKIVDELGGPKVPDYTDLSQDTVIICHRCHCALRYGKVICPKCKKYYRRPHFPTCYECLPQERKNAIEAEQRQFEAWEDEEARWFDLIDELEQAKKNNDLDKKRIIEKELDNVDLVNPK